jgi:hypothetical protein
MFANTPICDVSLTSDLGEAFERHEASYGGDSIYALGYPETEWLNVMRDRAMRASDANLLCLTNDMLNLLAAPQSAGDEFNSQFIALYNEAGMHAYPLAWSLRAEHHEIIGMTYDYTLICFDTGMVRAMEDEAVADHTMRLFVDEMLQKLRAVRHSPRHEIYRQVFEVYSEALAYRLLKERSQGRLRIKKIPKAETPSPDFECELTVDSNNEKRTLTFFIEVKTLDVVDATQRLPEMLDEGMDAHVEIERQHRAGKAVAIASGVIAPYRHYGNARDYDPFSVRQVIEILIQKAAQNFKATQFQRGPTFALANLLRLPLPGQGASALAPIFYDPRSGACVSGVLWHLAFGQLGAPIHRSPRFSGSGTTDGELRRAGILIDPALGMPAAGLIALHYDKGAYRLDGLFDATYVDTTSGWSDVPVETVLLALCGDYNDRQNRRVHDYALYRDRNHQIG